MTFGTSATARGNLGCPAAREAAAQGPHPRTGSCESMATSSARERRDAVHGSVDRHAYESQAPPAFSFRRGGTGNCPNCRTRCFGIELRGTAACPAEEQKGRVDREIAGSERGQTSEGRNPMDVARMKQAWQVRKARREEGPGNLVTGGTEQTLDVAPSREQGETELARAPNRTKTRRPKRPGNRSGRSPSLQYIEGAQNLRKACRALRSGAIRREGLRQPTPASGKVERKTRRRIEHKGHWPCSTQIGFGKPRVPGVAAQVVEDGTTRWVPTFRLMSSGQRNHAAAR